MIFSNKNVLSVLQKSCVICFLEQVGKGTGELSEKLCRHAEDCQRRPYRNHYRCGVDVTVTAVQWGCTHHLICQGSLSHWNTVTFTQVFMLWRHKMILFCETRYSHTAKISKNHEAMMWKSIVNFPHGQRWQQDPSSAVHRRHTGTDDLERELRREAAIFPNDAELFRLVRQ